MDIADAPGLLQQHRRLTSRLARRIGHSEAEDLASEAVAKSLGRPAPDGRQAPWLERIFRNLVVDRGRRAGRVAATLSRIAEDAPVASPEDLLLERERQGALLGAIPTIPLPLREALMARFYEDQDYDGVAAMRGISAATARTRVHRALARLRVSLGRLRAIMPAPLAFGTQSIAAAIVPAVFSAGLVLPPLIGPGPVAVVHAARPVVVAQSGSISARSKDKAVAPSAAPATVSPASPAKNPAPSAIAAPRIPVPAASSTAAVPAAAPAAVLRLRYEDDDVVGDLKRPGIDLVTGDPGRAKSVSLIEIPRSFEPAITKMLEDI